MAYDERLAVRVRTLLKGIAGLREREMFGGLAFMYRDRMCFGIVGRDLVVRVAADEFEAVMRREHVRPMDFTGTPLKRVCVRVATGVSLAAGASSMARARPTVCELRFRTHGATQTRSSKISHREAPVRALTRDR
jgi:TfoX-like protein